VKKLILESDESNRRLSNKARLIGGRRKIVIIMILLNYFYPFLSLSKIINIGFLRTGGQQYCFTKDFFSFFSSF